MKEKTLLRIDRDRLAKQLHPTEQAGDSPANKGLPHRTVSKPRNVTEWSPWPSSSDFGKKVNPSWNKDDFHPQLNQTYACEDSCIVSRIIAKADTWISCGDDGLIKKFNTDLSNFETIGRHNAFAAGASFLGTDRLVTSSGDGELKVWNLDAPGETCILSLRKEHHACVWSVDVLGDYAITGSLDHSAKLIDLNIGKCKHAYRAHVDSVNKSIFVSNSSIITGSADKSVSLWDLRTANCVSTSFSHSSVVNDISACGDLVASCDMSASLVLFDLRSNRLGSPLARTSLPSSINTVTWLSRNTVCVGCKDGTIVTVSSDGSIINSFPTTCNVLSIAVNHHSLMTADADGFIKSWF